MKKRKILFCNETIGLGGIERSLCDVLSHIDYDKYDIDLYLDSSEGGLSAQIPDTINILAPNLNGTYGRYASVAVRLLRQHEFGKLWLRTVHLLVKIFGYPAYWGARPLYLRYGKYDVVVSYKEGSIAQFARRAFKYKVFVSWWHCASRQVNTSEYSGYRTINKIIAVSTSAETVLNEILPETREKSSVIPNMVDAKRILTMAEKLTPMYKTNVVHLVTVARLSPEKHLENVISCAKQLELHNINFQWHIIGGGLLYDKLKTSIMENCLGAKVVLEGEQKNPYPYIKSAHLYVHTSYIESQGITILEAMVLGVPCVVTKSLGPCEFIEDGVNGILTEQSPESLAEKVLEILTNRDLYEHIRANTHCPEQFAPENVMKKVEELLEGRL